VNRKNWRKGKHSMHVNFVNMDLAVWSV